MNSHHHKAAEVAAKYIGTTAPLKALGWGVDGVVYPSPKDTTAVKIHRGPDSFRRELAVYHRLRDHDVSEFLGFAVPRLVRFDRKLLVIEMSTVKPPFLLDFAGATLDFPRGYPPEAMALWWEQTEERFGDDFPAAESVYWGLVNRFGIYYYDLKPGNLQFR